MLALVGMVITVLVDVVGSKGFNSPLPGSTEISSMLQVAAVSGGMAYAKIDGWHIRVDFMVERLPESVQGVLEILVSLMTLGFFVVGAVMSFENGLSLRQSGTETLLIGIPLYPFAFFISLFCAVMSLVIIGDIFGAIDKTRR